MKARNTLWSGMALLLALWTPAALAEYDGGVSLYSTPEASSGGSTTLVRSAEQGIGAGDLSFWSGSSDTGIAGAVSTEKPSARRTPKPARTPNTKPSPKATATPEPTLAPTEQPTSVPTPEITAVPTEKPSARRTPKPARTPNTKPSPKVTATPEPTLAPTEQPTPVPTAPVQPQNPQNTHTASGVIAEIDTEVRLGPGKAFESVGILRAGDALSYLGVSLQDSDGTLWHCVYLGNLTGWVSENDVAFGSSEGALTNPTTPESVQTPEPVLTPEPTIEPTMEPLADSISRYTGKFKVSSSSYRYSNTIAVYGSCAMDGNLTTAWNTNERIKGEWLDISVQDGEEYCIAGIRIGAGYWKNKEVFTDNSAPKTIDIYCDDEYVTTVFLKNARDFQTFWFAEPVIASSVRLEIRDGYRGRLYADCCITEVELLGPAARLLSSEALEDWGASVRAAYDKVMNGGVIQQGDYGLTVAGLQLLLRDGFGVLDGTADGSFGNGTKTAVNALAEEMVARLPECEPMRSGVVDRAYWQNMIRYMDQLPG